MKALKRTALVLLSLFLVWQAARLLARPRPKDGPLASWRQAAGDVHYTRLIIAGEHLEKGIYDPSVAWSPDGKTGWLAYSSVTGNGNFVGGHVSLGEYVSTHLARTTDGGTTWTYVAAPNISKDGTCEQPDGNKLEGVWRYEVSSLVCDPDDPAPGRRWKLFAYRYFWQREKASLVRDAWIVLRTAADPGGEWSEEIPLFGAGKNPLPPYHHTQVDVNALDASLQDTIVYTEPGALVHEGRLYVSLTALRPHLSLEGLGPAYSVVLLASEDHGASWKFAGPLLSTQDAHAFGYDYFDGTALAVDGGHVFLLAVPGGRASQMHDGCAAFEFASLKEGRLRRGDNGLPVVANYFAPQPGILSGPGAGQACYHEANTKGGVIFPQFNLKAWPDVFQLYQTGRRIQR